MNPIWSPPRNLNILVIQELPYGFYEHYIPHRMACGEGRYYFCPTCKGWITGEVNEYPVNNSERKGMEYFCRRCGEKIYYSGI